MRYARIYAKYVPSPLGDRYVIVAISQGKCEFRVGDLVTLVGYPKREFVDDREYRVGIMSDFRYIVEVHSGEVRS